MILTENRRDHFFPLTEIASIPARALERLAGLGVTTIDELRDLWIYGDRQTLLDYLDDSPIRWFGQATPLTKTARGDQESGSATPANPLDSSPGERLIRHPRGLISTAATPPPTAPKPLAAKAPGPAGELINLAKYFPPVRNQGARGTCVAFASIALLEYHFYRDVEAAYEHSEQFVYWACKQIDGRPNDEGTYIKIGRQILADNGACLSPTWRYQPDLIAGNESHAPPPAGAVDEAAAYTRADHHDIDPCEIDGLCSTLDQGQPVVLGVQTFPSWDYPNVAQSGEIQMPLPNQSYSGGHAVCLVGYEKRPGIPGDGAFIFRNSWGGEWGEEGRFGGGYGTLFFDYVRQYGLEAFA